MSGPKPGQPTACDPHMNVDTTRLIELRTQAAWTRRDLAARADLSEWAVRDIEKGRRCTLGSLHKLAAGLGVAPEVLLVAPTEPTPTVPPLRPRLEKLLDEYDHAPRGSDDHLLAALVRATVSAHGAIGRAHDRDTARAVQAEQRAAS